MKRRQNLQTHTVMKSNNNTPNARSTYLQEQNLQLKEQNSQLAKELDEHKAIIRDLTKERDEANQELIGEKAFTRKIMECVKDIQLSAQINLTNLVSSSNCVTDILKMTHTLDIFNKKDRKSIHTSLSENVSIISSDVLKPNLSNPNIFNEITRRNTSRFTSLNPLSYILNLDPGNADEEALPVPKNFQSSALHQKDQPVEPGKAGNEINRLATIAEESQMTLAGTSLGKPKEPSSGPLPNDVSGTNLNARGKCSKLELTIPKESKSLRAENSIQRRSNSLSEEDQIELIDDSEIITPHVPLLSSTIITSSPVQVQEFRKTRSFENRRKSSNMQNETANSEPRKSLPNLVSSKASTISDSLRLDSSNPTISKLEALMSYNLVSVKNYSTKTQVPSERAVKSKVDTKTKAKKAKRRKRISELDKIIMSSHSPILMHALALRAYRTSRELRSKKSPKIDKKFKEIWRETHTPKLLRPKTGSLKEPNLRNKLRR